MSDEEMVDIAAASIPAMMRPEIPGGSPSRMKLGKTSSAAVKTLPW